jgi:peptidoglycan hydrolase-like protein with peptidoglycan-binding domain
MSSTIRSLRATALVAAIGAVLVGLSLALAPVGAVASPSAQAPCSETLQEGSSGGCVSELQSRLNGLGANLAVDGAFGPATKYAVLAFQGRSSIGFDGVVGPDTQNHLNNPGSVNLVQADTGSINTYIDQVFGADSGTAKRIAGCESSLRETAINFNTNGSYDLGVFQDNTIHAGGDLTGYIHDMLYYQANIQKAHDIYAAAANSFQPWYSSQSCWG